MLTKEYLEDRISKLETEKQEFITRAQAQVNIYEGALQNTRDMLSALEEKPKEKTKKETK